MVVAKKKGSNAERELLHMFWANDIATVRIAGSGSSKHPMPDLIAGVNKKLIAIECKNIDSDNIYFKENEIYELEKFAIMSGMMPFVAVRVKNEGWYFLHTNSLNKTKNMHSFNRKNEELKDKILNFEKIVRFLKE